jgi:hypothetical protein
MTLALLAPWRRLQNSPYARCRLGVECLEPRLTPSSDPFLQNMRK